jgi:hypothetical protein
VNTLRSLFQIKEPTCPGCGRTRIRWTDTFIDNGSTIERNWDMCPEYRRLRDERGAFEEKRRHYARWYQGKVVPLVTA